MSKEIYTTSAPSSGGIMLGLLNVLEPLNITSNNGLKNPLNLHRFIEALKFAFGARSWVTDPAFAEDKKRLEEVYTKEWADEIRKKITDVSDQSPSFFSWNCLRTGRFNPNLFLSRMRHTLPIIMDFSTIPPSITELPILAL